MNGHHSDFVNNDETCLSFVVGFKMMLFDFRPHCFRDRGIYFEVRMVRATIAKQDGSNVNGNNGFFISFKLVECVVEIFFNGTTRFMQKELMTSLWTNVVVDRNDNSFEDCSMFIWVAIISPSSFLRTYILQTLIFFLFNQLIYHVIIRNWKLKFF